MRLTVGHLSCTFSERVSEIACMFSGCVHVLRLRTRSQVAYTFSGCVHVLRLRTCSQVAYTFSGCIHVLSFTLPF